MQLGIPHNHDGGTNPTVLAKDCRRAPPLRRRAACAPCARGADGPDATESLTVCQALALLAQRGYRLLFLTARPVAAAQASARDSLPLSHPCIPLIRLPPLPMRRAYEAVRARARAHGFIRAPQATRRDRRRIPIPHRSGTLPTQHAYEAVCVCARPRIRRPDGTSRPWGARRARECRAGPWWPTGWGRWAP